MTQVIAPAGHGVTQPRIAPAPNLAPRTIVAQSTPQSPGSHVGQPIQQVTHPTTAVTILPQGRVQTTTIAQVPVQTSISQGVGLGSGIVPPQQVTNIGQVPIRPTQVTGQVALGQVHTVTSIQAATQQMQGI